ncbi:MAG: PAS domain S-box protein [Pseudomonadota bacterium]
MVSPHHVVTVDDATYREQEELLFRTTARLKGLLFYRLFIIPMLLLAAWHVRDAVTQPALFWPVLGLLLGSNLFNTYLGFRGSTLADKAPWPILGDAAGYTALAALSGGHASDFVYFYFLLVAYSFLWLNPRLCWGVGAAAMAGMLGLLLVSADGWNPHSAAILLALLGLTLATASVANLVARTRDRMVNAAMELLAANRRIQEQQAAQRASEERLRLVLDTAAEAIIGLDLEGRCMFANRSCVEMLGYRSEAELLGREMHPIMHHTHPDGRPYPKETCRVRQATLRGESTHCDTEVHWRADGSSFPTEYWSHPIRSNGEIVGSVTTFVDISGRRRAEQALRRAQFMVENTPQEVWLARSDGRLVYANRAAADSLGYTQAELAGMTVADVNEESAHDFAEFARMLKAAPHPPIEVRHRARDGRLIPKEIRATHLELEGEDYICGFAQDITERKRAEETLRRLNEDLEERVALRTAELVGARDVAERASRAKSEFLSRMSHELRTPLNAILGFGQLLELEVRDRDQADNVQEILHAGRHLLELINEVLDLARIEAGKLTVSMEPLGLRGLLQECLGLIQPMAEARGIGIAEPTSQCETFVFADRTRLKQVLLNLLSNAVKYNREGGTVSLACVPEGDAVQIRVSDTGPGLTGEQRARLFTAFERLDADRSAIEGTGIGLALSKRLMEVMAGEIGVESTPGKGSTFWIRVAAGDGGAETERPAAATPAATEPPAAASRWSILCIEDNPANLRLIERVLARRGDVRLLAAHAPGLGLELARTHRPDLILLDINLPDMDGWDVMRILREHETTRAIPVVAISANAMPKDIARGRAAGCFDYLTKPLDVERLLGVLDQALANGGTP